MARWLPGRSRNRAYRSTQLPGHLRGVIADTSQHIAGSGARGHGTEEGVQQPAGQRPDEEGQALGRCGRIDQDQGADAAGLLSPGKFQADRQRNRAAIGVSDQADAGEVKPLEERRQDRRLILDRISAVVRLRGEAESFQVHQIQQEMRFEIWLEGAPRPRATRQNRAGAPRACAPSPRTS